MFFAASLLHTAGTPAAAQVVEKKIDNGEDRGRYNWVILSEGYTESEADKFQSDSSELVGAVFAAPPFAEYKSAVNVYTIFVPSEESGADHPSQNTYVDTALDATYETYGINRLLTVNAAEAFRLAAEVPYFDTVLVLVNDEQYGGSGGSVIVSSTHEASSEIILHEAGHIIGGLADEYVTPYPGYPAGDWEPNVTYETQRGKIPWSLWIDPGTPLPTPGSVFDAVGLFEGARYESDDIYRPRHICKMRQLNQPFCEICLEALVLNIYSHVSPIEDFSPAESDIRLTRGQPVNFSVTPLPKSDESGYEAVWAVGDRVLDNQTGLSASLPPSVFEQGTQTVTLYLRDSTPLVRKDAESLLTARKSWQVTKKFCSGSAAGTIVDAQTGREISGAVISLAETGDVYDQGPDGTFELKDIACGGYTILVESDGFDDFEKQLRIDDGSTEVLEIRLNPATGTFYITGSVTGAQTTVSLKLEGEQSDEQKTEADGRFTIGPLRPGEYILKPEAAGYRFFPPTRRLTLKGKNITAVSFSAKQKGELPRLF